MRITGIQLAEVVCIYFDIVLDFRQVIVKLTDIFHDFTDSSLFGFVSKVHITPTAPGIYVFF